MDRKKVIIDCDNTMGLPNWEVDDGLVILYLLGRDDIEILGITSTFGNSSLKNVVKYTNLLLEEIGRTDIPQFNGEAYNAGNGEIHSDIRAGNRYEEEFPPQEFPTEAAKFMANQVRMYPGQITVLALGPVGNLYDAWRVDHNFYSNVKEIIVMGGYTQDLYIGNVNCHELNLSCNPKAAYNILHAECQVVVFNGHICLQAPFGKKDLNRINYWPESRIKIIENWLNSFSKQYSGNVFYLWDLLPAVYISFPELFNLKKVRINPTVESLYRGMLLVVDEISTDKYGKSVEVIMPDTILDRDRMMDILETGWSKEWSCEPLPGTGD